MLAQRLRRPPRPQVRTVRVRVKGGYRPSVVHAQAGVPLRIVFSREETAACSEHVVFPAFGKSAMLPEFEDVAFDLMPEQPGEYEFTCQLGMLRGRLVVADDRRDAPSESPPSAVRRTAYRSMRRAAGGGRGDTALLAFGAWLCSLPLLLLVAVPLVGWRAGGLLTLLWLGVVAATCFAVCAYRIGRTEK